jgi:hypothetical protein
MIATHHFARWSCKHWRSVIWIPAQRNIDPRGWAMRDTTNDMDTYVDVGLWNIAEILWSIRMRVSRLTSFLSDHYRRLIICVPDKSESVIAINYTVFQISKNNFWHIHWKFVQWGNLRDRDHLEDPGVDSKIILKWILKKWNAGVWTGFIWLRIGTGGRHC